MLSDLILINRNSTSLGRNNPIDVFGRSLYAVDDIVDDMEISPDEFSDASDTYFLIIKTAFTPPFLITLTPPYASRIVGHNT